MPNPKAYLDTKKNELSQKMKDKGISAITPTNSNYTPSIQTAGASKNARRNIKLTTQRIKRTIKKFCNRHNKTKKCRHKFNKK